MNWFSKLLGKTTGAASHQKQKYCEGDNLGTRFTSADQAGAHRLIIRTNGVEEPCIDYCFNNEADARIAMLEIPCIKIAKDTNNLICTEILKFGVFKRYADAEDAFIATLAGKNLTYDTWIVAKRAFEKHGGQMVVEVEPHRTSNMTKTTSGNADAVKFSHEENRTVSGFPATYHYYNAPDKASAIAFLQKNPVTRGSFFLVVKTPEGVFCRDTQGFFEQ